MCAIYFSFVYAIFMIVFICLHLHFNTMIFSPVAVSVLGGDGIFPSFPLFNFVL